MEEEDPRIKALATTRYIGDGVYAALEPGRLKLSTERSGGLHVIYLEADVMCNLLNFLGLEYRRIQPEGSADA